MANTTTLPKGKDGFTVEVMKEEDFDWYYTNTAKRIFAKISPDSAMYKGPGESKM